MTGAGQAGTGKGLRIEGELAADVRLAFPFPWLPRQIEPLALQECAKGGDRVLVGGPGFLAAGVADLFMEPGSECDLQGLGQPSWGAAGELLCHAISS
jgi:hypothetical protein